MDLAIEAVEVCGLHLQFLDHQVHLNRHHSLLSHFCVQFNPLAPELAVTSPAKITPQIACAGCNLL